MPVEFAQHGRHRPDKHSGIPAKISLTKKRFGQIRVRFFTETDDMVNRGLRSTIPETYGVSLLDVTKAGACPSWFDSDRYQRACLFGRGSGRRQSLLESH